MGGSKKVLITIKDDLIKSIDDFRFENRFESRSEAIRWLISWALKQNAKP